MKLSLACYSTEGKFEGFLSLGIELNQFGYYGDFVDVFTEETRKKYHADEITEPSELFKRDEKDPLNRFNELFNGRTFGNGRFVLIVNDEDGVYHLANGDLYLLKDSIGLKSQRVGSIHENPELFSKL